MMNLKKLQSKITWKSNAVCNTVNELARAAKMDMDARLEQTTALMPEKCFHSWVTYAFVFTRLINRDRPEDEPQLLDILRTALFIYLNYYLFTVQMIPV